MQRFMLQVLYFGLVVSVFWSLPDGARAHGTGWRLLPDARTQAIAFYYSDGEPMSYAKTLVFSPQDPDLEHQNGRTDKKGRFVFCPDTAGTWRITVSDGMGHRAEATVAVAPDGPATTGNQAQPGPDPGHSTTYVKPLKILAGLSLILNLGFIGYFFKQRADAGDKRA